MGRIIDITFNEKTYSLEFDRYSVLKFMEAQNGEPKAEISNAIALVRCGLIKHHSRDLPSEDEIFGWLIAMGEEDLKAFISELNKCIEEVTTALKETKKTGNLKWGVRK